jgi:trimeric autotransporter adhesin
MFFTTQQVANRTKGKSPARAMKRAREASSVAAAKAAQAATLSMQGAASAIQSRKAQAAAQAAAAAAQIAAHSASDAAQAAAQAAAVNVRKQVGTGIHSARSWAAPRLENAADYTTKTAAPKVSSALKKTARQVKPSNGRSKRSVLGWTALGAAILAAVGAGAAVARYRYRTAIAADSEQTDSKRPGSKGEVRPNAPAGPVDANADTSVNGRVTTSKW